MALINLSKIRNYYSSLNRPFYGTSIRNEFNAVFSNLLELRLYSLLKVFKGFLSYWKMNKHGIICGVQIIPKWFRLRSA